MADVAQQVVDELTPEQELAAAFLSGVEEGEEIQVEPTAEEAPPAPQASTTPPNAEQEQEVKDSRPADEKKTYTFQRKGKEVTVAVTPEEELAYLRAGYDYTEKTQEVAAMRREVEQMAQQLRDREAQRQQELRDFLTNPSKLRQLLEAMEGRAGTPAPSDVKLDPGPTADPEDDTYLTAKDVKRLLEEATARAARIAREEASREVQTRHEAMEVDRLTNDYHSTLTQTVRSAIEKFPDLTLVEGAEELLFGDARRAYEAQKTLNPDRAVDMRLIVGAIQEGARRRADRLGERLRSMEKTEAARRADLAVKGPEPAGGAAPPQPRDKVYSLKDPDLDAMVVREIQGIINAGR